MALFKTRSAAVYGIDAHLIDVEVDMYAGSARDFITVGAGDRLGEKVYLEGVRLGGRTERRKQQSRGERGPASRTQRLGRAGEVHIIGAADQIVTDDRHILALIGALARQGVRHMLQERRLDRLDEVVEPV